MKKIATLVALVSALSLAIVPASFAQPGMRWRGSDGWGRGTPYSRLYNPRTVTTIRGEVIRVDTITPMHGMGVGLRLLLRTSNREAISVHLGPDWYLERQEISIEPRDRIEVVGSRVTFANTPTIIAAEVKKGNETLVLRDKTGFPVWSGWRRRSFH